MPTDRRTREPDSFRPDIEGLRGIAVGLVLVFHAGLLSSLGWLPGGFIGVDLFFVVSGYLITGLLLREHERNGRISFSRFYARRVRRILPAGLAVLLITIPIAYVATAPLTRNQSLTDAASAALSVANVRFAITADYFNQSTYSPFLHYWSLGVEEQFYIVWPAVMALAVWRLRRRGVGVALSAIAVASFVAGVLLTSSSPSWAFYMLPTRAWQLAIGGLLAVGVGSIAHLPERLRDGMERSRAPLGWFALIGLVVLALVIDSTTVAYPGVVVLWPTLAGALLIATGQAARGPGLILRLPPVRFLGKISYSLYLWHWPTLVLGGLLINGPLSTTLEDSQAILLAGLSIVLAAVSWRFVEQPFRDGRLAFPNAARRVVMAGATAMAVVALVGVGLGGVAAQAIATTTIAAEATPSAVSTASGASSADPAATGTAAGSLAATPTIDPSTPLRPSIADAPKDLDSPSRDGCLASGAMTQPNPDCVYANHEGSYRVDLVGDSHAAALFPALEAIAVSKGWSLRVFVRAACPPTDLRMYSSVSKGENLSCSAWNRNVLAAINSDPPDLIVVSMYKLQITLDPAQATATAEGNGLGRFLARMPASARKVIVDDPPLPAADVPVCLSVHPDSPDMCSFARAKAFSSVGLREKIAAGISGASVVSLSDLTCPGTGNCPVIVDRMIVWRDHDHLTATFSRSLAAALAERLAVALLPGGSGAVSSP